MTIDNWFEDAEKISVKAIAEILRYEMQGVPKKRQYYFRELAQETHLAQRITNQMSDYRRDKVHQRELTNNDEIAIIYIVHRLTVSKYLKENLTEKDYKERVDILRRTGGAIGGSKSSTKGHKQKRTWSRKKK